MSLNSPGTRSISRVGVRLKVRVRVRVRTIFERRSGDRTRVDGSCDFEKVPPDQLRPGAKIRVRVRVRRTGAVDEAEQGSTFGVRIKARVRVRVRRSLRV